MEMIKEEEKEKSLSTKNVLATNLAEKQDEGGDVDAKTKSQFPTFFLALLEKEAQEQNRSGNSENRPKPQLPRTKCQAHTLNCPRFSGPPLYSEDEGGTKEEKICASAWGGSARGFRCAGPASTCPARALSSFMTFDGGKNILPSV